MVVSPAGVGTVGYVEETFSANVFHRLHRSTKGWGFCSVSIVVPGGSLVGLAAGRREEKASFSAESTCVYFFVFP